MLGFQYVVAKSRAFSSAIDRELQAASSRSFVASVPPESACQAPDPAAQEAPTPPLPQRNEGAKFLRVQQQQTQQAAHNQQKLLCRGQELSSALARARTTLQQQAASEQFLTQNFHLVARLKQQLAGVRALVLKVAEDVEDVETLLVQRCEESAARQNADFAAQQQQELEAFETSIAMESESRKRELLQMRRQKLASAFYNDLRTYQTLVEHHGDGAAREAVVSDAKAHETLDSVELVVTADPEQLAAFYESGSEQDEDEAQTPKFTSPAVPKELMEEEEKSEGEGEKADEAEEEGEAVGVESEIEAPAAEEVGEKDEEAVEVKNVEEDNENEEVVKPVEDEVADEEKQVE